MTMIFCSMRQTLRGICLLTWVFTLGCQHLPAPIEDGRWEPFIAKFVEAYFAAHPPFAVNAGRHEFDGQLPDWSPAALANEIVWLRSIREQALKFDAASLDEHQRFERDYLLSVIDGDLFWLEAAQWPYKNPMFYSEALDPNVYLTRNYAPLPQRMLAYIRYAKAIPTAVRKIRANLRTPLPQPYIDVGKKVFGGMASYYEKDVPLIFASVQNPTDQEQLRIANQEAAQAMKGLVGWLDGQRPRATETYALGSELFRKMLYDTERIDVPLDRLKEIGRYDLDRNLAALHDACRAYAPRATIRACISKAQANKPAGGAVAYARRQLGELKAFLIAKDPVTIPGTEEAQVAESPPYQRWNLAYIDIPGAFDKGLPSVYYVAPPDPTWSKAEQEAYLPGQANLLFVGVHEVWPGHFLQFQHAKRLPGTVEQIFSSYGFTEGWAHYAEEMMWEAGLGHANAEVHIGQLLNALLRNVRFLSAIGLHTQGMTIEESQRMFRELAYQDPGNARQQAARGTFDPAYLNYTLGKWMIRRLREEWTTPRGEQKAWREFHDTFLSFGAPPIPLIGKAMLRTDAMSVLTDP